MEEERERSIKKKEVNTIIISDLHLGSKLGQPEKVLSMLKEFLFKN